MRRRIIVLVALEILLVVGLASGELAVIPAVRNPAVEPAEGNWNDTYDYSVELRFNDAISIELWVWDPMMSDYCPQGTAEYKDIGNWSRIYWHVSPFSGSAGYAGHDSKFKFRWNGTDLKEREEGILRPLIGEGPSIKAIFTPIPSPTVQMFKDAMVKPAYGRYNDSFTYSVFTQLNQTTNITLEVFDISSYEWKEAGENQSYTETGNWQLLSWANVTNVSAVDGAGVASYRFLFFDAGERHESEVFYGPELDLYSTSTPTVIYSGGGGGGGGGVSWRRLLEDEKLQKELRETLGLSNISGGGGVVAIKPPELINATVTPKRGSWHESYDYYAVVEHPNRADMWLTLEVYCPGQRENYTSSSQRVWMYDDANIATVEWPGVNVFSEEDVRANESAGYYIHYNDGCNKDSWWRSGPELYFPPVLTNPSVSPAEGTYKEQFEYKVHVMDEEGDDVNVTLYIFDPKGSEIYNETHVINGTEAKGGITESWIYKFTEEAADTEFRYYFKATTDGIVSNTTGVRVGPYIKYRVFSLLWIIILAIIAGLAVVSGVLWVVHNRFFKREIEEEII